MKGAGADISVVAVASDKALIPGMHPRIFRLMGLQPNTQYSVGPPFQYFCLSHHCSTLHAPLLAQVVFAGVRSTDVLSCVASFFTRSVSPQGSQVCPLLL